jgi:hypothetical protein
MTAIQTATEPDDALRDAFTQAHNAVQWLARMVRSFRSLNGADDIILHWNKARKAFVTDEIVDGLQMELRIPELTLQFLENGKPVDHQLHMEGRSPAHVEAWVLVELLHRGIDRDRFSKDLPYSIPSPMVGDSVEYSPEFREEELREMLDWFVAATNLMKDLAREISGQAKDPELTLRSRDFSIEALIEPNEKSRNAEPVRVSFCPLRQGKVGPHYVISGSFKVGSADVVQIVTVPSCKDEIASPSIATRLRDIIERVQTR